MFRVPDSVVILGPKAEAIARLIRRTLPDLPVLIEGDKPKGRYALIAFTPGPEIQCYAKAEWVHIAGAGANAVLDTLSLANMTPALITRTVGRMGQQIGEYVLSYILADTQKHAIRRQLQRNRDWNVPAGTPDIAAGRTALILGTGRIGAGVARTLSAVGMRCIGANRSGSLRDPFDQVVTFNNICGLSGLDVCIGALPLTAETDRIIGTNILSTLRSALFINVGRGATADIMAVKQALKTGQLRHAVLDVVPKEPMPPNDPLWTYSNITITPHVSGITLVEDTANAFTDAYHAIQSGETPALIVDPVAGY